MQSILIISKNKKIREEYALNYCADLNIQKLDISVTSMENPDIPDKKKNKSSIGVEDIKNLQKTIHLKPFQSKQKASIIHDAQTMTIEAQNSMLKLLEEPPAQTIIILTADRKESLLPTILSRCMVIEFNSETEFSTEKKEEINLQIMNLQNISISEGLKLAEKMSKDKEKAIIWLEDFILFLRIRLINSVKKGESNEINWYSGVIKIFQSTHYSLKTSNVNLRMALEQLFITLVRS